MVEAVAAEFAGRFLGNVTVNGHVGRKLSGRKRGGATFIAQSRSAGVYAFTGSAAASVLRQRKPGMTAMAMIASWLAPKKTSAQKPRSVKP